MGGTASSKSDVPYLTHLQGLLLLLRENEERRVVVERRQQRVEYPRVHDDGVDCW